MKENWTDKEFDEMNWHDNFIHAISFPDESLTLTFDIDYLLEWELNEKSGLYNFWIAPCVLVFLDVLYIKIDLNFQDSIGLYIQDIQRLNPKISTNGKMLMWDYIITTDQGTITFEASGFIQKAKATPILSTSQVLKREEW